MQPLNTVKSWLYISVFVLCLVKLNVVTWKVTMCEWRLYTQCGNMTIFCGRY